MFDDQEQKSDHNKTAQWADFRLLGDLNSLLAHLFSGLIFIFYLSVAGRFP